MAGLLLSGPAGGGKSAAAREELAAHPQALVVDFQTIYAGLLLLQRDFDTGRYPERDPADDYIMPTVEFTRRAIITGAIGRGLFTIVTNSDGNGERRRFLLDLLGPGATERVIDPGEMEVERRLSNGGPLSPQCRDAKNRWYLRVGNG